MFEGEHTDMNAEMIELLLDISSYLKAIEDYIAKCEEAEKEQEMSSEPNCVRSPPPASAEVGQAPEPCPSSHRECY